MKAILMTVLFTLAAAACFGVFQFGVGLDIAGKHGFVWSGDTGQIDKDYNVNIGISPAMEYLFQSNALLYGLGAEYQVQRTVKFEEADSGKDGKMSFIPIYGVLRYQLSSPLKFFPELVGHVGYNFFTADDDYLEYDAEVAGGLYWGLGAGVVVQQKYLVQLMYKTNYGKYEATITDVNYKADITNTELNLSVNYRF
jgi:hypothetical protein